MAGQTCFWAAMQGGLAEGFGRTSNNFFPKSLWAVWPIRWICMTSSLTTIALDQIAVLDLLTLTEHAPTVDVGGDSGRSSWAYQVWLECAFERATTASTRRLIEDILDDISLIGPIDDELDVLVIGALASVESALECDDQCR